MNQHHILVALVENKSGVLNRISSLFRKRRFNIDSLNVGRTENPDVSRMTIVVDGSKTNVEQVIKQLYKIINVLKVSDVTHDETVIRETILLKIHATKSTRAEVMQFSDVFRAKAVDISPDCLIFELTSRPQKIEAFIEAMRPFGIKEMVRTGVTSMNRGKSGEIKIKEKEH
ncbi:acetolactate synthase small subunit [Candidatus Peregrinibacteria bacterium]|nr:MAG: acetolactate synthase small subunit [Candidatus Peregrinibacteria bacterium]